MSRPLLLDLFCCEGGAAMGYHRAGFDVIGVDVKPQRRYPFPFVQADALRPPFDLSRFDAIHASPPCQAYSTMGNRHRGDWPDLLGPTFDLLADYRGPWVVENVPGARSKMPPDVLTLTGGMFGLGVHRPRLFASNCLLFSPPKAPAPSEAVGVYGVKPDGRRLWTRRDGTTQRAAASLEQGRKVMGMPWASWDGCREAIPPAYTEYLGAQLLQHLGATP